MIPVPFNNMAFLFHCYSSLYPGFWESLSSCYHCGNAPSVLLLCPAAGKTSRTMQAPAMFTFHHANAYQITVPPTSSSNGNGHEASTSAVSFPSTSVAGRELLVLDTVGWESISFDANQHNLSPAYYKGGQRTHLRRLVFELDGAGAAGAGGGGGEASSSGRLVADEKMVQRCTEFPSVSWDMHGKPHR